MTVGAWVVLSLVATLVPFATAQEGVTAVTRNALWTFDAPQLQPKVIGLASNQSLISAASGGAAGGFVCISQASTLSYMNSTWVPGTGLAGVTLLDVAFVPNTHRVLALAVQPGTAADTAAFVASEDCGATWNVIQLGDLTEVALGAIAFSRSGSYVGVAAIGGRIYKSSANGVGWTSVYGPSVLETYTKVAVLDASLALVAGMGQFAAVGLVSTDDATTWTTFNLPTFSPLNAAIAGIVPVDAQTWVLITTGGGIFQTTTAGASWTRTLSSLVVWHDLTYAAGRLFAVGAVQFESDVGVYAESSDGGATWSLSPNQANVSFIRVVSGEPVNPQPTPSASPTSSPVSPSPSPSSSPYHTMVTQSPSPSSSPKAKSTDSDGHLALVLGLSLGLGGALVALVGGALLFFYCRRRNSYEAIVNSEEA